MKSGIEHHNFNFEYGDILSHLGAAWCASYVYHRHYDPVHNNCTLVGTWETRATYKGHLEIEKYFREGISKMSPKKLDTNRIGLSGEEVLTMAREVLKQL